MKKTILLVLMTIVFMVTTAFFWQKREENIKHTGKQQFRADIEVVSPAIAKFGTPVKEANSKEGPWIGSKNVGTVDPKNVFVFEDEFITQSSSSTANAETWLCKDGFTNQDDAPAGQAWLTAPSDSLVNAQVNGEAFQLTGGKALQYEARFSITDADKASWFAGLAITDTTILAGVTDAVGFRCPDDTGDIDFCVIMDSNTYCLDTTVNLADDTMVRLGFSSDGAYTGQTITAYVNDTSIAVSSTKAPHNEALTPSFEFEVTDSAADAMKQDYVKVQQER